MGNQMIPTFREALLKLCEHYLLEQDCAPVALYAALRDASEDMKHLATMPPYSND
jgi:hypothetical protein